MEIQVGEYVRTINGEIGVFKGYNANSKSQWKHRIEFKRVKTWKYCADGYVVKHSFNIIDLIEKGDYVNGYKVERVKEVPNEEIGKVIETDIEGVGGWEAEPLTIYKEDIKSIVTKEQFESIKYEV